MEKALAECPVPMSRVQESTSWLQLVPEVEAEAARLHMGLSVPGLAIDKDRIVPYRAQEMTVPVGGKMEWMGDFEVMLAAEDRRWFVGGYNDHD